jgi:hypothetical protein
VSIIDFDKVKHSQSLPDVIGRYVDLRRSGARFWGLCPFHKDTKPTNFNVFRGKDGGGRYRCWACGESGDVVDFIARIEGVSIAEAVKILDGNALPDVGTYKPKTLPPSQVNEWNSISPVPEHATAYEPSVTLNPNHGRKVDYRQFMERLDPYFNTAGALVFYVIRVKYPDEAKMTIAVSWCRGPNGQECWAAKRPAPPHPIMGADEIAARPDAKVVLVSGEKCKAMLAPVFPEVIVITWLGGDKNIHNTDWSPLVDVKSVWQWADADIPGNNAMNKIAKIVAEIEKAGTG